MTFNDYDYNKARERFYKAYRTFNFFKDINDDVLAKLDESIKNYKATRPQTISLGSSRVTEYINLLYYLAPQRNISFDEKILFVIRYFDPELQLLKIFFNTESIDEIEIQKEDNDFIRNSLVESNLEISSQCRKAIGISDTFIIKYELLFFKHYLSKELKFNIKKDFIQKFFRTYPVGRFNLRISDEELETIIKNAIEYKEKYGIPNINDLLFQLLEQRPLLNVSGKSIKELFIFMMYVLDEEFKALHIYNEYCNWNEIKSNCRKELGFYNKDFVQSEIKFAGDNPDNPINLTLF